MFDSCIGQWRTTTTTVGGVTDCMPINGLVGRHHNRAWARIVTAQQDSIRWTANTFRVAPHRLSSSPAAGLTCRYPSSNASSTSEPVYGDVVWGIRRPSPHQCGRARRTDRIAPPWRAPPTECVHACSPRRPVSCSSPRAPVTGQSSARAGHHVGAPSGPLSGHPGTVRFADSRCPVW